MDKDPIIAIAIIVVIAVFVFFLILGIRRRIRIMIEETKRNMRKGRERKVLGPVSAHFSGADHTFGKIKGLCVLALSQTKLHFRRLGGKPFTLSLSDLESVENRKVFNGQFKGGKRHLVITLKDENHVGFIVKDNDKWLRKIKASISDQKR